MFTRLNRVKVAIKSENSETLLKQNTCLFFWVSFSAADDSAVTAPAV